MVNYIFTFLFIFCISFKGIAQDSSIEFSAPSKQSILLLPVPDKQMASNSSLKITQQGKNVSASYSLLNTWNAKENQKFVRLLAIQLTHVSSTVKNKPLNYTLSWNNSNKAIQKEAFVLIKQPYLVFPNKSWLAESILLHPEN